MYEVGRLDKGSENETTLSALPVDKRRGNAILKKKAYMLSRLDGAECPRSSHLST